MDIGSPSGKIPRMLVSPVSGNTDTAPDASVPGSAWSFAITSR